MARLKEGVDFAVSFNRHDETGQDPNGIGSIDMALLEAIDQVSDWPVNDLFPSMLPVIVRNDFD